MTLIEHEPITLDLEPATQRPLIVAKRRARGRIARMLRLPTARGERLRHLAESARLEERPDQVSLRLAIWGLSLSLCALLIWASLTHLPEIAHGVGQLMPKSFERAVAHADAGRIIAIPAAPGAKVEAGHILVQLDTDDLKDQRDGLEARKASLDLLIEGLAAFSEGRVPAFDKFPAATQELATARAAYEAQLRAQTDQRAILQAQADQVHTEGEILDRQILQAEASLASSEDLLQRNEVLFAQKLVIFSVITAARQNAVDTKAALDVLRKQKERNLLVASELAERLAAQVSASRSEAARNLQGARADLAQVSAALAANAMEIASRSLRAPVSGTVHLPDRLAVGDSVSGGQPVAYLVPEHEPLVARIRIPAHEISQIHLGQSATLRISSFDYLKFGRVSGEVVQISPAALTADTGEVYYTAEIALQSQNLLLDGVKYEFLPGMVVTVDIINGSRTVLEYFLSPVNSALNEAFREG